MENLPTWMSMKPNFARLRQAVMPAGQGLRAPADHWSLAGSGAGRASETGLAGLAGRRACWVEEAGLRAPAAGGLAAASACGGGPVGSALMMLTAGIEAEDGEKRPFGAVLGKGAAAEATAPEFGAGAGDAGGGSGAAVLEATMESADCNHSLA